MEISTHEASWLERQRQLGRRLFVGIDHHAAQLTVAAATGAQLRSRPDAATLPVARFAQDGMGYRELLAWLHDRFGDVAAEEVYFVSEPTLAQPLGHFLRQQGYGAEQVLWVRPEEVPAYRKAQRLSRVGKNDDADARTFVFLLHDVQAGTSSVGVFAAAPPAPVHDDLQQLASEHYRLTRHAHELEGKIYALVLYLFPELRRVFVQKQSRPGPGGEIHTELTLDLFGKALPLAILGRFPSPKAVAEAGFDRIWAAVGGKGVRSVMVRQVVALAQDSAGVPDELAARRLRLLIAEYHELQVRLDAYRAEMRALVNADPVLRSLLAIPCVSELTLATLVGEAGNLDRFRTADQLKRYLGLAPKPMPQSGELDNHGQVAQVWRMPRNTYKVVQGKKQLVYRTPGKRAPRRVAWLWFAAFLKTNRWDPTEPFARLYMRYRARLKGQPRWLSRVRWKVVGKLVGVIFACLKRQQPYEPAMTRFAA